MRRSIIRQKNSGGYPAEIGNKVILGLDAHCAKQLANVECYKKAVELADKYNLNLIDELPGM